MYMHNIVQGTLHLPRTVHMRVFVFGPALYGKHVHVLLVLFYVRKDRELKMI